MLPYRPQASLPTHEVTNMPPHQGDQDFWVSDKMLREGVTREGAAWASEKLAHFGKTAGAEQVFDWADAANRFPPELRAFDRYGQRINQVDFHPAYHDLMSLAVENEVHNFAWRHDQAGSQVAHAALNYMFCQAEGGVSCPMTMTYAVVPALRATPAIGRDWIDRILSTSYDARDLPVTQKRGATLGMFMTEKQGGSDVRSNSTTATPLAQAEGQGAAYRLSGHKFFCSAPMSDAFLVLAKTRVGLSCFLVPRWTPDGDRNNLAIQRLKDKLGNRSNASCEIELADTWGAMLGEEGRGIKTIIDMVQGTRLNCCVSSAAIMRQSLIRATHHVSHRQAFGKKLIDQPLMRNVIADLAIESEAALVLALRLARAMDESAHSESAAAFARIGAAVGKYWNCKRAPAFTFEAMECLGGPGYIEDSTMPRLYREAPVNSIWEGSGNIICLDVLRALQRDPAAMPALFTELDCAAGANASLDAAIVNLKNELSDSSNLEVRARRLTGQMAVTLQAALLVQHSTDAVADAFCASRLSGPWTGAYGTLEQGADIAGILKRLTAG